MKLDISTIRLEDIRLAWLIPLCSATKPEEILISKEQQDEIFGMGDVPWRWFRDIPLIVKT